MVFQRVWDESCPRVWDSWDGADGVKWVIRDLRPEDDEEAIKILVENLCPDETLCRLTGLANDPVSLESAKATWRTKLTERMSLACYKEKGATSKLVALNVCSVCCQGDVPDIKAEGKAGMNLLGVMQICDEKVDAFKILDVDMYLYAFGLVVHRDYRGAGLGSRILAAREPLCLHHCVKGTSTLFTSPSSQRIAERVGFTTAASVTLKEFAEAGLDFPDDETRCIKVMVKKFACETIERK